VCTFLNELDTLTCAMCGGMMNVGDEGNGEDEAQGIGWGGWGGFLLLLSFTL
jgi:hypothetical protein